MSSWAGAWLKASVAIDLTMAMSSTTVAVYGSSSDSSAPLWPCLANWNFGPRHFELGLMNAVRYPSSSSGGGNLPSISLSFGL